MLIAVMLLVVSTVGQSPVSATETSDTVWIWSQHCANARQLDVTVRLGDRVLHHSVIPICRGGRDDEDGKSEFHFPANLLLPKAHQRLPSEQEEGDLWQAGGEADALILGFSLQGDNRIHLNTLHIAQPDMKVTTKLGRGLSITTFPSPARK